MDARISELSTQCKEKDEEVRRLDAGNHCTKSICVDNNVKKCLCPYHNI